MGLSLSNESRQLFELLSKGVHPLSLSSDEKDYLLIALGDIRAAIEEENEEEQELTPYHKHEVLHASNMAVDIFDRYVGGHPFVKQTPELTALAEKASEALYAVYAKIGEITL